MNSGSFGYQMLYKMGWKEGEKIGRNPLSYRKELHTIEPRAPGLGLGALSKQNLNQADDNADKTEKNTTDDLKLYDTVYIVKGRHKDVKGVLIRIQDDLCVVEVNEEEVVVPRDYLSKQATATDDSEKPKVKRNKNWLHPSIAVRVASKKYKDGLYYRKKGRVVDFVDGRALVCLDSGEFLEDVKEKHLEPAVETDSQCVYIIRGYYKGRFADVLAYDAKHQEFTVETKDDQTVLKIPTEFTAQYLH